MSPFRKIIFALFFLSGFCGLLYQVVWMRLAFAHFGIITPVLSVVVSVFMLGLALGSWLGGKWISRPSRSFSPAYAYAAAEGVIGLGAFIVPKLFPIGASWLLSGGEMNSASYLARSAGILSLSILPWCILMGTTFPLMMAFIREQEGSEPTSFSFLYLANVIGAMCGTILTADVFVELLGFKRTLMVAGIANFVIAATSIGLAKRAPSPTPLPRRERALLRTPSPFSGEGGGEGLHIYWILFLTGFTSMSLEVIWVRDFTSVLGTTIYAFALIVAVYLLATWIGSTCYRVHTRKGTARSIPELIGALAASSLWTIFITDPRLNLKQAGVVLGIFPFSFFLGYLTPGLIDQYSSGDANRAGRAYAVNIAGCILGPLAASYVLLPWLGVKISMILMAVPYVIAFLMNFKVIRLRARRPLATATAILLVSSIGFGRSYEERFPDGVVRRDSTATVICVGKGMDRMLIVNGVGITSLDTVTKVMAHLPLLLVPHPTQALDICFGMGTTYRSLLTWDGLQVTAVELVPSVKKSFGYFHADADQVMANPRGRVIIDDGRRFLNRTQQYFDVVTIDPPPPIEAAGSSLLYTREFYQSIKRRLKPHGVLQQWFPGGPCIEAQAIARSLKEEFPYVQIYIWSQGWGVHFIASNDPIVEPPVSEAVKRLSPAAQKDLLEWESNTTVPEFIGRVFTRKASIDKLLAGYTNIAITDDRPFNEYYLLRRSWAHYSKLWKNFKGDHHGG